MEINNVEIGTYFKVGKNIFAQVVDIYEVKSLTTGEHIKYTCIAKGLHNAVNSFETPFASVVRGKVEKKEIEKYL